ncbi:MAG TPA: acyltransferase [Solirubrobacteraceae bacterium]|nr:acyltransferase [Solirubrobacteraceae bacterium]
MIGGRLRAWARAGNGYLRGQRTISWYVERGLRIGEHCDLQRPFELDPSHCWLIEIGDDVTFAPHVHVIVHDASTKRYVAHTRLASVRIGSRVFVGARTTILPGVTIGDDVLIGAGSVVSRDVPSGTVVAGNPARALGSCADYEARVRARFATSSRFDASWTVHGGITAAMKAEMGALIGEGEGFVV